MMADGAIGPAAIIVHSRDQALSAASVAVELGRPLTLRTPPDAVSSLGVGWFVALAALLRACQPTLDLILILDCGDEAGIAMAAFRRGLKHVRFSGPPEIAARLSAIAAETDAALDLDARPALDLANEIKVEDRCRAWLSVSD
jgi:hypothetical protein